MLKATLRINPREQISPIDPRLYSSFVEHMGRAVYTGLYEPGHPTADANGFRQDVMELIRPLGLHSVRYPGGNFVSGYDWKDGIGPKEKRPVRCDLAWFATETNQVGVDEFCGWCAALGIAPMLAVNLGTGTPRDAVDLLEYCNDKPEQSAWGALRAKNGRQKPHGVKLWCLGNEMDGPWQICSHTASEYARVAHETAKMMKWQDPSIELVACGSSMRSMPTFGDWERTILRECWEEIDYLSLHSYYQNTAGDTLSFLAQNEEMDAFIREVEDICREVAAEKHSQKKIALSFDEWNVWYHFRKEHREPERWLNPRPIEEEEYDYADALLVGAMLTTLLNHADSIKISCLAQLINVIAPITTLPGGKAFVQTIYWPFLHASRYGRGTALRVEADAPTYACVLRPDAPSLATAAVLSEAGDELTLFVVNKTDELALSLPGLEGRMCGWTALCGHSLDERNSAEASPVAPVELPLTELDQITLPAESWNVIRIHLA